MCHSALLYHISNKFSHYHLSLILHLVFSAWSKMCLREFDIGHSTSSKYWTETSPYSWIKISLFCNVLVKFSLRIPIKSLQWNFLCMFSYKSYYHLCTGNRLKVLCVWAKNVLFSQFPPGFPSQEIFPHSQMLNINHLQTPILMTAQTQGAAKLW